MDELDLKISEARSLDEWVDIVLKPILSVMGTIIFYLNQVERSLIPR